MNDNRINSRINNVNRGVNNMAKVITFSIQKGGTSKTTSVAILSYLLSKEYKVLAVDMDSQGNLTEMLTQRDIYDFEDETVFEALQDIDAKPYVYKIKNNLYILPAEDNLAVFSRHIYTKYVQRDSKGRIMTDNDGEILISRDSSLVLRKTLETVKEDFDFILIDTPPSLSDLTVNSLGACDGVVVVYETSQFCYSAVSRFLETVQIAKQRINPELQVYGIMPAMIDSRRMDSKAYLEIIREEYKDLVFHTVIKRKAAIARLPVYGFEENKELNDALIQYRELMKELLERVQ